MHISQECLGSSSEDMQPNPGHTAGGVIVFLFKRYSLLQAERGGEPIVYFSMMGMTKSKEVGSAMKLLLAFAEGGPSKYRSGSFSVTLDQRKPFFPI